MNSVTFNNPVSYVAVPQLLKTFTALTITQMVDNPIQKVVSITTKEIGRVVLWQGSDYDSIGQWTDADVANKLHQLYGQ
jgi:hypothetical protein